MALELTVSTAQLCLKGKIFFTSQQIASEIHLKRNRISNAHQPPKHSRFANGALKTANILSMSARCIATNFGEYTLTASFLVCVHPKPCP